ncbi:uncharacterized protein CBL_01990 [Carabus blaptoides fortunei]
MWYFCNKFESPIRLDGKTAIITGGNTGIGKETAKDFYLRGARVLILCRNEEKAKNAIEEIKKDCEKNENKGEIVQKYLDLEILFCVRTCANEILIEENRIDILVNNAGVFGHSEHKTKDGFEMHFGVNYLGHFLLTFLLLPKLRQSKNAKIINLTSVIHKVPYWGGKLDLDDINLEKKPYSSMMGYVQSKLELILFTKELDRRLKRANINNVSVYSVHPGVVATEIGRNFNVYVYGLHWIWKILSQTVLISPKQGAQTTIYCAISDGIESGLYYSNCAVSNPSSVTEDEEKSAKLWDMSIIFLCLQDYNPFVKHLAL